ncbi:hypothetical protein T484DRAFT_1783666 [Baffinella frigidus]|nr:hypothetical protein T484DRAFT_1783666 [Cryptophyta sp. CCMP2293]
MRPTLTLAIPPPAQAAAAEPPAPPSPVEVAVDALENQIMDARRSRDDFVGVLTNILLYVANAAKNPGEAKFRRVRGSNKAFQAKVAGIGIEGAVALLEACGFAAQEQPWKEGDAPERILAKVAGIGIEGAVALLEACGFAAQEQPWKEGDAPELIFVLPLEADQDALIAAEASLTDRIASEKTSAADRLGELVTTQRPEDADLEELWRLSCEMRGHEDDVKGLCITTDGMVVTASRDKTLRLWGQDVVEKGTEDFTEALGGTAANPAAFNYKVGLEGHEYHVAALVLSGSYDWTSAGEVKVPALVNVWENGMLRKSLKGHTATVSCLAPSVDGKMFASGSWVPSTLTRNPETEN